MSRRQPAALQKPHEFLPLERDVLDLLGGLHAFLRVVETGSFSAVAREAGGSQSAVTRQITQLEEHFGVRLLHRSTRRLSLTDDGQVLVEHARQLLQDAAAMELVLGRHRQGPVGHVRMSAPSGIAKFLAPRLGELTTRHPGLSIELLVREHVGDLIEARLDLAVLRGEVADPTLVARQIGQFGKMAIAAPSYLDQHGTPATPDDLAHHSCIVLEGEPEHGSWQFVGPDGPLRVRVGGPLATDNQQVALLMAVQGHGIALLTEARVFDDLKAGRLIRVLADYPSQPVPLHIVYPSRRNLAPRTRAVLDFIVREIRGGSLAAELARQAGSLALSA